MYMFCELGLNAMFDIRISDLLAALMHRLKRRDPVNFFEPMLFYVGRGLVGKENFLEPLRVYFGRRLAVENLIKGWHSMMIRTFDFGIRISDLLVLPSYCERQTVYRDAFFLTIATREKISGFGLPQIPSELLGLRSMKQIY